MRLRLRPVQLGQLVLRSTSFLIVTLFLAAVSFAAAQELAKSSISAPSQLKLDRMLLLLKPSASQKADLDRLLTAQQAPGDTHFHQWLTPAQFTSRFAPTSKDAASVVAWLKAQGFVVAQLPASRGWIEFSGTAAQVTKAFGASVVTTPFSSASKFQLSSKARFPAEFSSVIEGLVSLDGTESVAASTPETNLFSTTPESLAAETSIANAAALTPALATTALHLPASTDKSASGAGETIAILSRSNVRPEDFIAFRKAFTLPPSDLTIQLNGPDPGRTSEEATAIQAASWAGVAAPQATILLVSAASTNATDGIDLALAATLDAAPDAAQNAAQPHTIAIGFSSCESSISRAHQAFYASLYRQAAAEGISILAATGDSGAAACHAGSSTEPVSTGYGVNALASTPWNTAIGAAAFDPASTATAAQPNPSSPKIPALTPWRPVATANDFYATGGGASSLYSTPAWQSAQGVPTGQSTGITSSAIHDRYLPDLTLPTAFSSTGVQGLAFCFAGDTGTNGCRLVAAGGSSVAASLFAGVAATLAQKYGPQGNLAPNLYAVSRYDVSLLSSAKTKPSTSFTDITTGSTKLPCLSGTPDCSASAEIGYDAAAGYDMATGLGSVNVETLLENWAKPQAIGTAPATVTMTTVGGSTYNPSATIPLAAKVISGSGGIVPTGTVQFYDETVGANTGTPVTLTAAGIATYSETGQFTDGSHNIAAIYSGDATYASAESDPITFDIQPSATALTVTPSSTAPIGGATITVTGVLTSTDPGATAPTGLLTVNLDGVAQGTATFATKGTVTSAMVSVTIPATGVHTVQGTYAGDTNYESSTSPSVTVTASKVASVTTLTVTPTTLTTGITETLTATVAPATAVVGTAYMLTGSVSFYDGNVLLGTVAVGSDTAVLTGITLSASTNHSLTAVYTGDATYSASTSTAVVLASTLLPVTVTLTESTQVLSPGQAVTLTAVVTPVNTPAATVEQHPSGYVLFYAGNVLVGTQAPVLESTGYSSVASTFVSSLAAGTYTITAVYSGDPTYAPATSNTLTLQVEDFGLTCSATNITMVQGTTQAVPCTVSSLGGLTGSIQVVCEEQNPPTLGAITCTFDPSVVNNTGTTTLTVVTTAGNISENRPATSPHQRGGPPPWQTAGGGIAIAFAGLLLSPIGRRARRLRPGKLLLLVLLLTGMAGAGLGCSNTTTLTTNTGTPLGEHTLKLTAAAVVNTVTVSHYAYLTVNVTP